MAEAIPRQKCPNCGLSHDVSVYVSGQRLRCRCGLHFEVQRQDVRRTPRPSRPRGAQPSGPPEVEPAAPCGVVVPSAVGVEAAPEKPAPPVAPPTDPGSDLAPTMVGRPLQVPGYELLELLGRGGMGEVWKARQLSLGRTVAIKALSPELARDADFVRRFEKEAAALAALSHPGLVQIIERGFCEESQTWYIAMEFCEGRSLRDRMESGPLSPREAIGIVSQVCRAIDSAHSRGVIHRDLKPENILVDAGGQAKIVDFGLAGLRGGEARLNLTQAAMAMGTLHYMAPEQRSDARSVDERADVFALGVILYELLAGEVPVGRFKAPSERRPGVDPRVDRIVLRALESEPDARYQSAEAMALDLDPLLATAILPAELLSASPAPRAATPLPRPGGRPANPGGSRRLPVLAAAGVGGLVLLFGLGRLSGGGAPQGQAAGEGGKGTLGVELSRSAAGGISTAQLTFRPGSGLLHTRGEWRLEDGRLVAHAPETATASLAEVPLRAEGVVLEAQVSLGPAASADGSAASRVEIALEAGGGARLALGASLAGGGRYELRLETSSGEVRRFEAAATEPLQPGQPLRLKLVGLWGEVEASAGSGQSQQVVFKERLPLEGFSGKPRLTCSQATCSFSSLRMAERVDGGK